MVKNNNQSGFALIIAILMIALVSASGVYLLNSGYTVMRIANQRIENERFLELGLAIESHAVDLLHRDNYFDFFNTQENRINNNFFEFDRTLNPLGYDPHNDSYFELWSTPSTPQFIKDQRQISSQKYDVLYITDLNQYFNINNLHFSNTPELSVKIAYENNVKIFKSLLKQILDASVDVDALTNEIIDWLDHDDDSISEILLTEDDVYRRGGSSYRPANRPITNLGELSQVIGMSPTIIKTLSEYVVALPVYMTSFAPYRQAFSPNIQGARGFTGPNSPALTKININTCSIELLRSIYAIYDIESSAELAFDNQGYFQSILTLPDSINFFEEYLKLLPVEADEQNDIINSLNQVVDVYSQLFLVETFLLNDEGISFNLESVVFKDNKQFGKQPQVVQRHYDWLPMQKLSVRGESKDEF